MTVLRSPVNLAFANLRLAITGASINFNQVQTIEKLKKYGYMVHGKQGPERC